MDLSPPHTILISQTMHVAAASDTIPADDIIAAVTTSAADTMAATNTNENPDLGWPLCYMASNQFGKPFCYVARHKKRSIPQFANELQKGVKSEHPKYNFRTFKK